MPAAAQRLAPLEALDRLAPRGMRLGLAAMSDLAARLGGPERSGFPILVAGTNGKGSTAATLSAILTAAGVGAGLYTSPHLEEVTERIRVDDEDVRPEMLAEALSRVFEAARREPEIVVSYFEALTAAAFLLFRDASRAVSILEVGLGGRLDATNVADAKLSLVASIGVDHVAELGPTVDRIAREKAGVFRPGQPALGIVCSPLARQALEEEAARIGASWRRLDPEVRDIRVGLEQTRFRLRTARGEYALVSPLAGRHQVSNVALAVVAAEELSCRFPSVDASAITRGVSQTRWAGRLEAFAANGRPVFLDGCHNADGAAALAAFLEDTGLAGRVSLLFGVMADKDIESISARLFPAARRIVLTRPVLERAAPPEEIVRRSAIAGAVSAPSVAEGLDRLLSEQGGGPILIAGSLYLVGEARRELARRGALRGLGGGVP